MTRDIGELIAIVEAQQEGYDEQICFIAEDGELFASDEHAAQYNELCAILKGFRDAQLTFNEAKKLYATNVRGEW